MLNIYFVQANNVYGTDKKSVYFPYAAGCIEAFLLMNETIKSKCHFNKIQYTKLPLEQAVKRLDNPFMVLFSCSVWNMEYNKALAEKIKEAYPECYIVFGGHSVSYNGSEINELDCVDFVTHRFGEEPTLALLLALINKTSLDDVPNLSYKKGNEIVTTELVMQTGTDYPSPYLNGIFDDIMKDDIEFSALFETNRGCPNSCSFCDWSSLKSKVRLFPMERVKAEIDWFAENEIEYIYCADGNFCLFQRDDEIADYVIESKINKGYPKVFKVNFTKNKLDFVFSVGKKFCTYGLDKAQTISFQSLDTVTLANIGRKNISAEKFRELMIRYNKENISTYCELILGLPGETYESFTKGVGSLMENGQHFALNIYPCELIPHAEMAQPWYRKKFRIESTKIPFSLQHISLSTNKEEVSELTEVITSTYSLSNSDWIKCMLFSYFVQAMHNLGLLRLVAIFCRNELNIPYDEFYKSIIEAKGNYPVLDKVRSGISKLIGNVSRGEQPLVTTIDGLSDMVWSFDEAVYINCYKELDAFLSEIKELIKAEFSDHETLDSLFDYQQSVTKKIGTDKIKITTDYNFPEYFSSIYTGEKIQLNKADCSFTVLDNHKVDDLLSFAREIMWYGRNRKLTDYTFYPTEQ